MPTINQAINSTRHLLAKEVDNQLKILAISRADKEGMWRGKKIISTKQWESWKRKKDFQYKLLDYIPEDFVEIPLMYSSDDKLGKLRSEWYKDYTDFLEYKKSSSFGESKCRQCILHPFPSYWYESLRELILMGFDYDFPCKVLNMFECPYKQGNKDSDEPLFTLKVLWQLISDALSYAHNLSRYYGHTYEVDFEKCTVTTYSGIRSGPSPWGRISELESLKLSKIPMQGIKDIYYVLSNSKALEIILEQYLKHVEEVEKEGKSSDAGFESKFLRKLKEPLIDHFGSIKDKIKIEKLLNFDGKNLEEEKEDKKRQEETEKWLAENEPQRFNLDKALSGKCILCKEFSNIHCINCDIWVCVDHWRKHDQDSHNMD